MHRSRCCLFLCRRESPDSILPRLRYRNGVDAATTRGRARDGGAGRSASPTGPCDGCSNSTPGVHRRGHRSRRSHTDHDRLKITARAQVIIPLCVELCSWLASCLSLRCLPRCTPGATRTQVRGRTCHSTLPKVGSRAVLERRLDESTAVTPFSAADGSVLPAMGDSCVTFAQRACP